MLKISIIFLFLFNLTFVLGHGDHIHENEEQLIQAGKEKWFKQPSGEDEAPQEDTHGHDQVHKHEHGHDDNHGHDHHHHDHIHQHGHTGCGHDHGHGHSHEHHHHTHDHHHGHDHSHGNSHSHDKKTVKKEKKPRTFSQTMDMWWQAIFATLLISAAPFFILFFVPLESNSAEYQPLLKVLLSFASGGLLGDAFLHLIPHAIHPHTHGEEEHHDHDHGHDHSGSTKVGLWVLAGIYLKN